MAKQQQQMMGMAPRQQKSKQPRGGSMEAMLIQGEAGLNETMDFNAGFIANPMQNAVQNIFAKDAAKGNALQKSLAKPNQEIDQATGGMVKVIPDRNVREVVINQTRGFKQALYQSGGQGMDIINGEIGDLERAVAEWNKDKTNFSKNINGPEKSIDGEPVEPHYSAGTSLRTLDYNAMIYGGNYESVSYNSKTKELEWVVKSPQGDYGAMSDEMSADYQEYKKEMSATEDQENQTGILSEAEWTKLQGGVNTGSNKEEMKAGRAGTRIITQSDLDKGVVLKDASVQTKIQDNVITLVDMGTTGKAVTRDDEGNVMVPGFDLNALTNNEKTLITMAWDNHLHTSGGKTWAEHWMKGHKNDNMNWAKQDHDDFDNKKLKDEVTKYYQTKMNTQYENGVNNQKDNTVGGRTSVMINNMIDNAFSANVDGGAENLPSGSVVGPEGGIQMNFDVASIVGENGDTKMEVDKETGNFNIMVYNNSTKEYEIKQTLGKNSDIDKFKRTIKIYFGDKTAY